jgi:hypothetical protein
VSQEPNYRVYCYDGLNKVVSAEWVEAQSDQEAIALIEAKYPNYECELWEGRRLVAKIQSSRRSA